MNKLNSLCSKANNLTAWKLLLKLKQSSLKEASEYFGLDNAQSSRIISSLEKELDYELLDRSHKPYRLNENFRILEKNLALMVEAVEKAGYKLGEEICFAMDLAASEFYKGQ